MAPSASLPRPRRPPSTVCGFIDNDDWTGGLYEIDRLLAARLLAVLVKVIHILLVDGADGYDHDLNLWACRKIPHLTKLRRVIKEVVEWRT